MSKEQYTILDLSKVIKIAREHAILGVYAESLNKYKSALTLIQK